MYTASKLVDIMRDCADSAIGDKKTSKIVFGTVQSINPLSILLDGHEKPLHESFFYLSRNVKACEESLRVRAIKGKLDGLDINITAKTIAKMLKGQAMESGACAPEGEWEASAEDPADEMGIAWKGKDEMDTAFYDQTLTIDVIRNRGLKTGDFVLCTSHDNQQLYMVWEVLNRLL